MNPLGYNVLGTIQLGNSAFEEKMELSRLVNLGLRADYDRASLLDHWKKLTRLRYGIREPKTFPWKNASNLSIPFIDSSIRKYKPMLMRLIVEADPVVEFVGEDPEAVQQERLAEITYNWLFKTEMNALEPLAYIIDTMAHRGHAWAQVGWEYTTEYEVRSVPVRQLFPQGVPPDPQSVAFALILEYDLDPRDSRIGRPLMQAVAAIMQGAPWVKLAYRKVVADRPAIWDRDPVQMITPPRCTDYRNAEWIIVQHVLSDRKLQQLEADGFMIPGTVEKILGSLRREQRPNEAGYYSSGIDAVYSRSLYSEQVLNDDREKIFGREDEGNILLWEVYHWYDYNQDGLKERTVTFVHPRSITKCCSRPYSYPFPHWPFVKFDFERTNRRVNSPRGISGLLKDLQREINTQHNNRLDAMTLRNAPVYQVPLLAGFKARNFRVVPGTVLQLPAGAQITPIIQDRSAYPEQVNEENMLRAIGEQFVGIFDANITSPISMQKARTATEIQAAMQYTAATATMDSILFQLSMRDLHTMIWELFMDLGPEEVFIRVPGQDPNSNEPELRPVKKSEINKKYKLIPTGSIANTNRALQLANAREAMQIFLNDLTGFINPYFLRQWFLTLLDPRWGRKILNPPAQAQELQTLRQAAAAAQTPEVQAAMNSPQHMISPDEMPQGPRHEIAQVEETQPV